MATHPGPTPEDPFEAGWRAHLPAGVDDTDVRWSFTTSRGPGGQNVNKRATRAELRIALNALPLDPDAITRLRRLAGHLVTDAGELVIGGQSHRSQEMNKDQCAAKLADLVTAAKRAPKKRRPTKPSRGAKERRIGAKKRRGDIKRSRKAEE